MELTLSRETLCFERLALSQREQVSVEGEATLQGSMRDAVTVLSVQAQAYLEKAEAVAGGVLLKGHVSFRQLYTQGVNAAFGRWKRPAILSTASRHRKRRRTCV